ncbi:GNAT family N-acetyltransferase [Agrococcus sp. ARC_14]|uniref:GNAT family N-acetyltransferase n=1 Tax=Agrococcus sp. ARC_14 TaxID=2919927 RepID=UPI001F051418|nr:GNAT family N-acetyltransferase [Agrococcus sp. ARC_14]MCH1882736.1 GNAT family N-acetyltransferase [Agrococcus sp. ARC_14]
MTIELLDVAIPDRWDEESETGRRMRDYVDVRNAVVVDTFDGDESVAFSYRQAWANWRSQEGIEDVLRVLALDDGEPVGRGYAARGLLEAQSIGELDVLVLPNARRRGVGASLADDMIGRMRERGVTTFQAWVTHRPTTDADPGPQLTPPTGLGSIAADTSQVRMLQRYGFALEQIERMSELRLATASTALADHRAEAEALALPRYRIETWEGRTPAARLEPLAALHARMSTDAPAAALDHEEERWDTERLSRYEDAQIEGGRTLLRAVAIEEGTDAVAAFTTLVSSDGSAARAQQAWYQHDTLVHAEHRGQRLGMLVKAANLQALLTHAPAAVVRTWNASENTHMLAVNEALGFTRISDEGVWQRKDEA